MGMFIRSKIIRCRIYTLFIIVHIPILQGEEHSQCPSLAENPICPCYKFKEGMFQILLLLSFIVNHNYSKINLLFQVYFWSVPVLPLQLLKMYCQR